jgi:hypothetical protein
MKDEALFKAVQQQHGSSIPRALTNLYCRACPHCATKHKNRSSE